MIHADYLFLLTDVDGLYTSNPRKDPDAKQIEVVTSISAIREKGWYQYYLPVHFLRYQSVLLPSGPVWEQAEWKPKS